MSLKGANELRRRFKAISLVSAPSGNASFSRLWQEETVKAARPLIPVRTGATRASVRPGGTRKGHATVVGKYTVNFIDAGSKAHVEPRQFSKFTPTGRISKRKRGSGKVLKFQVGGQTMFRRKVNKPRIAAHPFKKAAGQAGIRRAHWSEFLIGLWNRAA